MVALTFDYQRMLKDSELLFNLTNTITSGSCASFEPYASSNYKEAQVLRYDENQNQLIWGPIDDKPAKIFCQYCYGITFDDSRGNCAACGGERE